MTQPTVTLGASAMRITPVGVGTAPIGSTPGWRINWGPQDEGDAIRAIQTAIEMGVNWIDTAPFYGWGRAEEIVGRSVRDRRDRVYIFTKCGTVQGQQGQEVENLTPASIRREVEASLRRLQTDHIDLLQFHDSDLATPIEESWATMQALIAEGKVRYGGLSNHPIPLVERARTVGPVVAHQHQYNMLHRDIERDILPFSRERGIGVLAWSPLASGFLIDSFDLARLTSDDFRLGSPFAREPLWSKLQELRATLRAIAHGRGKRMEELAIAWLLSQPGLTGAIIGVRDDQEAARMTGGMEWTLTDEEASAVANALAAWAED
ncbi:MAG TPA: aldo/keto reductase [Ktedonobacterales bacterium]|nr:aldo/keto reductase [Ktedonobacterales bacterium]